MTRAHRRNLASGACEIAWFTEAIVKRSRSTLLPDMIAGGEALGPSYRSPYMYGTKLGEGSTTAHSCSATCGTTMPARA